MLTAIIPDSDPWTPRVDLREALWFGRRVLWTRPTPAPTGKSVTPVSAGALSRNRGEWRAVRTVPRAVPCTLTHLAPRCTQGLLKGEGRRTEQPHAAWWGPRRGVASRHRVPRGLGNSHGDRRPGLLSRWLLEEKFLKHVPRAVLGPNIKMERCP